MLDWLLAPIDPQRIHSLATSQMWHGRLMVLAWGLSMPLGILLARYFKITRNQNWPEQLDNKLWWHAHLGFQTFGTLAMLVGIWLIFTGQGFVRSTHALLGWSVVALTIGQILGGLLRGSKGGPASPLPDGSLMGDHYAMTRRRRIFEHIHKLLGYIAIGLAMAAILSGLWQANAPRWMWITTIAWWSLLLMLAVIWQRGGHAVDTYQAIWGPDGHHPGNQMEPIGFGVTRPPTAGKHK